MQRLAGILLFLVVSCMPIRKATYKAEEEHYALYRQKALVVYNIKFNKVLLINPSCTRCYFLKGRKYVHKWSEGDTMIIDKNLPDFYDIRFCKCE